MPEPLRQALSGYPAEFPLKSAMRIFPNGVRAEWGEGLRQKSGAIPLNLPQNEGKTAERAGVSLKGEGAKCFVKSISPLLAEIYHKTLIHSAPKRSAQSAVITAIQSIYLTNALFYIIINVTYFQV